MKTAPVLQDTSHGGVWPVSGNWEGRPPKKGGPRSLLQCMEAPRPSLSCSSSAQQGERNYRVEGKPLAIHGEASGSAPWSLCRITNRNGFLKSHLRKKTEMLSRICKWISNGIFTKKLKISDVYSQNRNESSSREHTHTQYL